MFLFNVVSDSLFSKNITCKFEPTLESDSKKAGNVASYLRGFIPLLGYVATRTS